MSIPPSRYIFGGLPWYSTLIVIGAALAVWLASREEKRSGLPDDTILDLALRILPIGILGARLYYVIFSWKAYRDNPVSILYIWEGGLAIYGGLIAGFLCIIIFCRRRNLSFLTVCDTLIPGVALAQAIGRWGNYFNQEAYGLPISNPGFQFFPLGVQVPGTNGLEWHMATFFYESVLDFGLFIFLILRRVKMRGRRGDALYSYLFLYAAIRLIVENFRMDSLYAGQIRISQILSVILCGGMILLYGWKIRNQGGNIHPFMKASLWAMDCAAIAALILYCIHVNILPLESPNRQLFFLLGSTAILTVSYLFLLSKKEKTEAQYANDQA